MCTKIVLVITLLLSQLFVGFSLDNGHLLPALGFSTWNHFGGSVSDSLLREVADAMVSSGLVAAGYRYLNLDDGWCVGRNTTPPYNPIPDPKLFPVGFLPIAEYLEERNLTLGLYTARGSTTCLERPGSNGYEVTDANFYAENKIGYLKEDSCGGITNGTVWEQYARMRNALNQTNRSIYFSITEAVPYTDGHPSMHCYGDNVFTVVPWYQSGLDPTTLANSYLVEYCNNMDFFGYTDGDPQPGGMLSNLDAQQLLTFDNLTVPGAFNDNDMLEVCNGGQTTSEYRAQFSLWAILASPLILGNDPRNMDQDCLDIITNADVIAVNQDPLVKRAKLVYQWPEAIWPNVSSSSSSYRRNYPLTDQAAPAPYQTGSLTMAPCNTSSPAQLFTFNASGTGLLSNIGTNFCLTYGGYHEANTFLGSCTNWTSPGIGSQLWYFTNNNTINNQDNPGKVLDIYDCNVTGTNSVQVCTEGAADCYASSGNPGCGNNNQIFQFNFDSPTIPSVIRSVLDNNEYCVTAAPLPTPKVNIQLQIWAKPLVDGSISAIAFNRSPGPLLANFTWSLIGIPPTATVNVTDLWTKSNGIYTDIYQPTVQPHDVVMIKATIVQ